MAPARAAKTTAMLTKPCSTVWPMVSATLVPKKAKAMKLNAAAPTGSVGLLLGQGRRQPR